jgi:ATP-dependent Clp protease ATP-binding subunit ClpB
VDFKNTIIIMTSNIGSPMLLEGISETGELRDGVRDGVMGVLRSHFRPEFLNRVDEIVLFKPLMIGQITRIIDLLLGNLQARLDERKITLELTARAKEFIAREAYDPVYGARPLLRYLQQRIETPLAREIIGGHLPDGQKLVVDEEGGKLVFQR